MTSSIKIPLCMYKDAAETANAMYNTQHEIQKKTDSVIISVDYSSGSGSTPAERLLDQVIAELQPRIASSNDISQRANYISDLGRILPLIVPGLQKEIKDFLIRKSRTGTLLQLKDRIVDAPMQVKERYIDLDINIFYSYIEKMVREEGYLAQLVRTYLKLDQKNWIFADLDLLNNFTKNTDTNAKKLKLALLNKTEPLFISTTTGNHAFAVKVDFHRQTLFLANPGEDDRNCESVIEQLKQITGCIHVISVITKKLDREEDIPFNDLCTVDSLALAQMMMEHPILSEECLNNTFLKTGVYVNRAISETDEIENRDEMDSELSIHQPPVCTTNSLNTPSIHEHLISLLVQTSTEDSQNGARRLDNDQKIVVENPPSVSCNFKMQILGGFITALGASAVAIAFIALNAGTFGIAGLVLAGVGIAATLAGVGLFARSSIKKYENTQPNMEQPMALLYMH
ncbi:hypothetical protein TUM19329_22420 [Legionella antarctica]|uniref:Uncharacterized protein n=1 Tax=Legionella antarctica TaxID=2708020 RepID=A0A6F8T601_9GAMM|nr:hypothetical protein [Legionella antarctica]BCA95881.1 hypothetical protein TUM19329_22420 [Legionella antarctica]